MIDTKLIWLALPAVVLGLACGGGAGQNEGGAEASHDQVEAGQAAPPEPTELDAASVAARMQGGEDIFLLDVRTPEELQEDGVIAGYTHIPIGELESRIAEVPKDKPIVAY